MQFLSKLNECEKEAATTARQLGQHIVRKKIRL